MILCSYNHVSFVAIYKIPQLSLVTINIELLRYL